MLRIAFLFGTLLVAAGCSSVPSMPSMSMTDDEVTRRFDPDRIEVEMDRDSLAKSLQSPLYILNIKKEDIPDHLPSAEETYADPISCLVAKAEYERLNLLLGSDEAASEVAEFSSISLDASDAVESAISDFIPFEDVIKYVSGATKHEKKVAAAYFRGQIRRAYLKGYISRNACKTPTPMVKPGGEETGDVIMASNQPTALTRPARVQQGTDPSLLPDDEELDRALDGALDGGLTVQPNAYSNLAVDPYTIDDDFQPGALPQRPGGDRSGERNRADAGPRRLTPAEPADGDADNHLAITD